MIQFLRRFRGDRKGAVATEFVLTFPALLLATLIIFDIGYAIFTYSTMSNAAADAARLGSVKASEMVIGTDADDNDIIGRGLADADMTDIETYTATQLAGVVTPMTVTTSVADLAEGRTLIVTISHNHNFFVAGLLGIDGINLNARSRMLLL